MTTHSPSAPLPSGCEPACRGCAHRHRDAPSSESQKQQWLSQRLQPWAASLAPLRAVTAARRWGYRDRTCLRAQWGPSGWQLGLMVRRELLPIPRCPIHSERVRSTIALLGAALPPGEVFPLYYLVQSGAQVTLVVKRADMPPLSWLSEKLQAGLADAGVEGLWLHLHPSVGRKVFHKNGWHLLWGQGRSRDEAGLWYGAAAFQQLLPELYHASLDEAEEFLAPAARDQVVDLYCGIGSSLRRWRDRGARCIGVELGAEALACAALNVPGVELLRGACEARVPQLAQWVSTGGGVLYVNPPRTGLEAGVRAWVTESWRPARIAYLSCSAGTLRRDLDELCAAGYVVRRITPYDFFPQTYHVETLVLLERG